MFQLTKRHAVVTGGASGIGWAVVQTLLRAGAQVTLCDFDAAAVEARVSELANANNKVRGIAFDVTDEAAVRQAFDGLHDPLHILVNCAGIAHVGRLDNTTAADFDRVYAVNVRGTFLCMQAALPKLVETGGGAIVNMGSIAGTVGLSDRLAYSTSKGAVLAMTRSVAKDYIGSGVRCNAVSPARVHTPFVDGFVQKNYPGREAEKLQELARAQPIGRMGTPNEIAALVLYLCSDEASFVTGADYLIDGGYNNVR